MLRPACSRSAKEITEMPVMPRRENSIAETVTFLVAHLGHRIRVEHDDGRRQHYTPVAIPPGIGMVYEPRPRRARLAPDNSPGIGHPIGVFADADRLTCTVCRTGRESVRHTSSERPPS